MDRRFDFGPITISSDGTLYVTYNYTPGGASGEFWKFVGGSDKWQALGELERMYLEFGQLFPASDLSNIWYATDENGQVWRSVDGGRSWQIVAGVGEGYYVTTLAINPLESRIIYAGTMGMGIYKSTDGGGSWVPMNTALPNQGHGLTATYCLVDPLDPQTIYMAWEGLGAYQSADGGETWAEMNTGLDEEARKHITTLAISDNEPRLLFAGTVSQGVWRYDLPVTPKSTETKKPASKPTPTLTPTPTAVPVGEVVLLQATPIPPIPVSPRLVYVSGQEGEQTLWLWDLTQPEPTALANGAQVQPFSWWCLWHSGCSYGVAPDASSGLFSVYFVDPQGKMLLASAVERAFGAKSPDGSKMLVEITRGGDQRLELLDIASGQRQTVVEVADELMSWFMRGGDVIAMMVTQRGVTGLYVVDADLQQVPQELARGGSIYRLWLHQLDALVWVTYAEGEVSLHIYNLTDGITRELLRGPNIRWSTLSDSAASFTLDRADGSEQYFLLTADGFREVNAQLWGISPDQRYAIYQKERVSYLGKPGEEDLHRLDAGDLRVAWTRFTTDSKYVVYIAYASDQSEFAVFTMPTMGGEARELARFTAPSGSSDPSRGVATSSYPAGYALETSRDTARGGFAVSPDGAFVLSYWSWLKGDQAGTHRLLRTQADGAKKVILSEGAGILPVQPQFTPDGRTVFAIVQGNDGLQELRVYSADGTSTTLVSPTTAISYEFTADQHSAILGVSADVGGNRIYLVDLATLNTSRIADGTNPRLLNRFSIDGRQPWQ